MAAAVRSAPTSHSWQSRVLRAAARLLIKPGLAPGVPVARRRARLERIATLGRWLPRGTELRHERLDDTPAEWIRAATALTPGAVLYLHGGMYTHGSARVYRDLTARLSRVSGLPVAAIDYRLAPEHAFPAAIEDATRAFKALLQQGLAPDKIVIAGDSAGGGLAVATALMLRETGLPQPAGLVCFSPWADLALGGASMASQRAAEVVLTPEGLAASARDYAGAADLRNPYVSPVFADLAGIAPLFIQVGSDEILLDDAARLAKLATAARVRVEIQVWHGMWHVWQAFAGKLPEADRALGHAGRFIRERVSLHSSSPPRAG